MTEGQRLEALAGRLRAVEPVRPSPAAKIRGWNLVLATVEQSPRARSRRHLLPRLVLAPAAAAILLVAGAVAASANSLPDSPLYPVKGIAEQARGVFAFSPSDRLAYHLELAQTRLLEAEAMIARHRVDLADETFKAMDQQLENAAAVVTAETGSDAVVGADLRNRLEQAIAVHDRQLAGLQGQVTNPTAQDAIARARDRAAKALEDARPVKPSASPSNNGQGQGSTGKPSISPHPTKK